MIEASFCSNGVFVLIRTQEDFMKAVRKIAENKKLEGKVDYAKV